MPEFSSYDINDAKRRVQEMRRRAQSFTEQTNVENDNVPVIKNANAPNNDDTIEKNAISDFGDDSFALILTLILILSNEGADNMIILALLYILL